MSKLDAEPVPAPATLAQRLWGNAYLLLIVTTLI